MDRCSSTQLPTAPPTCALSEMMSNIETEIQTLMKAFLTATGASGSQGLQLKLFKMKTFKILVMLWTLSSNSYGQGGYGSGTLGRELETAFKKLIMAHNRYGFEDKNCKMTQTVYYRHDKRVGKSCNLRTSAVSDAAKQLITFERNFIDFHGYK